MYNKYSIVLAVAAFIKNTKGNILIVKKSLEEQIDASLWTIPVGKVKPEEPIIEALKREVNEEVGLGIVDYEWIGEYVFTSNGRYFHAQHFLCSVQSTGKVKLEQKLLEFAWITKHQLSSYSFPANIKKRLLQVL